MSIIATVGRPDANSFASMAELNTFMNANDLSWVSVPESQRAQYAITSAGKLSAIQYLGQPLYRRQNLAFPRKNDVRVSGGLYSTPELSTVPVGYAVEDCIVNVEPDGCVFTTSNFPATPTAGTPLQVTAVVQGVTTVLFCDATGNLLGGGYSGTIDFVTGRGKINATPDSGTVIQVAGNWLSATKVQSSSFVLDQQMYEPDYLKNGSVHLPQSTGFRDYLDITGHNIVTGEVTLHGRMTSIDFASALVFAPHDPRIVKAQLIQILAERGLMDWDRRAHRGYGKIKIGDTETTYTKTNIPAKVNQIAGKYRVHEITIGILGPLTIYGKMGMIFGEWNASTAG